MAVLLVRQLPWIALLEAIAAVAVTIMVVAEMITAAIERIQDVVVETTKAGIATIALIIILLTPAIEGVVDLMVVRQIVSMMVEGTTNATEKTILTVTIMAGIIAEGMNIAPRPLRTMDAAAGTSRRDQSRAGAKTVMVKFRLQSACGDQMR